LNKKWVDIAVQRQAREGAKRPTPVQLLRPNSDDHHLKQKPKRSLGTTQRLKGATPRTSRFDTLIALDAAIRSPSLLSSCLAPKHDCYPTRHDERDAAHPDRDDPICYRHLSPDHNARKVRE
jgi:hypothetical protein